MRDLPSSPPRTRPAEPQRDGVLERLSVAPPSYVGNGAGSRAITLDFVPAHVHIFDVSTGSIWRVHQYGNALNLTNFAQGSQTYPYFDSSASSFTVGTGGART